MSVDPKKLRFFKRILLDFVRKVGREHLPWRKAGITAYEVWVSEVMLQQTQVSRVIGYYERFLQKFPTVEVLAQATWEEFLPYYAGLGYYQRGRNMLATAQRVVVEYAGEFPREKEELMQLPGIGDYTASAILSFAHDEPYLAYDTNLKRVMGRFFFGSRKAFDENEIKDFFQQQFKKDTRELNAGLMDFGSGICTGRPKCATCPLSSRCVYFAEQGKQEQTEKKKVKADGCDWKNAPALVFLHEKHKKYFSSQARKFQPFVIPATHNTRTGIKAFFREQYDLELAVRPPHKQMLVKNTPFILVNAQILLGQPAFTEFTPDIAKKYLKTLEK